MQHGTNGTAARNGQYTVAEVAELLGITTRAVRKRIDAGRLQAARTPHGWAVQLDAEPSTELPAPAAELTASAELEEPSVHDCGAHYAINVPARRGAEPTGTRRSPRGRATCRC